MNSSDKPREKGFYFPAEWEQHESTWLSYPHNENSWPGKIQTIFPAYHDFIATLAKSEKVHINIMNEAMRAHVNQQLLDKNVDMGQIYFHYFPTNDAWIRDHGPAFVINPRLGEKAIVDWRYNAWGGKYPAEMDNEIPGRIAEYLGLNRYVSNLVMEGGSIDVNGKGTLITTSACLLHENRNAQYSQGEIEEYLGDYYGVEKIIWLGEGIEGDDTDGHVDDITRFVNEDTVITVVEPNENDPNHIPLKDNLKLLNKARLHNGKQMNVVELPMPTPLYYEGQRLPASYANFYIANNAVIVPTYKNVNDDRALRILETCFPDRQIVGIDSTEIIWGLGSFHCLSQQEPLLPNANQ